MATMYCYYNNVILCCGILVLHMETKLIKDKHTICATNVAAQGPVKKMTGLPTVYSIASTVHEFLMIAVVEND